VAATPLLPLFAKLRRVDLVMAAALARWAAERGGRFEAPACVEAADTTLVHCAEMMAAAGGRG
jgi:hypothetical protein